MVMAEPISSNMRDNGVDAVSEVNPTKLSWSLVVGVVRLYEMQNQWNPAEVYSVEMVLQDERGDQIHCSIPKQNIAVFKTLIREHELYSMKNFIVKGWGKGIRTCDHKYKLNFYIKTSVSRLTSGTFPFNPFRFVSYEEVQAMPAGNENHLIDYIGHVVGKEDVTNMVTKSGRECKLLGVYLEDLQKNRLKCTLFGDLVSKVEKILDKADGQPLVMVTQLFKPHLYLNEVNIQNSFHVSQIYINPDFPDVAIFRDSLTKEGDLCSQGITHIQSQPPQSVSDEINGDSIKSVEEILNMREESTCWVVGTIVSIEHGVRDWCYASCGFCPRKVQVNKDRYWCEHCRKGGFNPPLRYRLNTIITDGTGCIKIIIWNYEARVMIGKTANEIMDGSKDDHDETYPKALNDILEKKFLFKLSVTSKNINCVETIYTVLKISDDESIIGLHSSQSSSMDTPGVDELILSSLATGGQIGIDSGVNSASVVCLSKDSGTESNDESGQQTLGKVVTHDVASNSDIPYISPPEVQGSSNKIFRRGGAKRKME